MVKNALVHFDQEGFSVSPVFGPVKKEAQNALVHFDQEGSSVSPALGREYAVGIYSYVQEIHTY